jgi:DNA-binding transcriptional MerR regulator
MIVSSFIDDELVAIVIINELSRFISIRGTFIFDIKIIEAFIDGLDVDETLGSIVYKQGYDAIDALISVKQYFDGDLIDTLNDKGFSLKQIGDFMNNLISEAIEQDITDDEHIDQLITTSLDSLEPIFQQLEQQEQIRQPLDPMGLREVDQTNQLKEEISVTNGGKNNPKSKHKAKYHKKYKKFVSKYIIKKKKKQNKNKSTHGTKNKTKKNKRLTKPKAGSKSKSNYAKKTLKNKNRKSKSKSKSSNHKSKHNKKANTNYYNLYKHNKTLKH